MSALVIIVLKLELVKKKSKRQCMSGFLLLQVNLLASGLKIRQMSTISNKLAMYRTSFSECLGVVYLFQPLGPSYNHLPELSPHSQMKEAV